MTIADYALRTDQATRLAHALSARIARERQIRVLSIKGAAAVEMGLRGERASADADVLVDPGKFDEFCASLESRGWHTRVARTFPRLIEIHSRTYIHDRWSCDIDVHRAFPGFFASPTIAFNALWESRAVRTLAGQKINVPSRAGMAAIVALHAERTPHAASSKQDRDLVIASLRDDFSESERRQFLEITKRGRAQWVLRVLIDDVQLPRAAHDAEADQRLRWTQNQSPARVKLVEAGLSSLKSAPIRDVARTFLQMVWVSRKRIPRNNIDEIPTRAEAAAYQIDRWRRGVSYLVQYVRHRASQ